MREKRREALTCSESRTEPGIDRPDQNELPRLLRRTFLHVARGRRRRARLETPAPPLPLRWRRAGCGRRYGVVELRLRLDLLDAHLRFTGRRDLLAEVERGGRRCGGRCGGDARAHDGGRCAVRSDATRAPDVLDELFLELFAERDHRFQRVRP